MIIAAGIIALLGTILTFVFTQITRRQTRINHAESQLAKTEAEELDTGMDRVDGSGMQPPSR